MWRRPPQVTALDLGTKGTPTLSALLTAKEALITIGGVSLGGVGKSEVALWLATRWVAPLHRGELSLISHGYLGGASQPERVSLPPRGALSEAERREALARWGDEAIMSRWRAPDQVTVWAGGDWQALIEVSRAAGAKVQLCDGALYCRALQPSAQLCLFDPSAKARLFPLGELSRPPSRFPQGVLWWEHRQASEPRLEPLPAPFQRCAPIIAQSRYHNLSLIRPTGERVTSSTLRGKVVQPWLGVARPQRFLRCLERIGAVIRSPVITSDHGCFSQRALSKASREPSLIKVCTYKDLPRLPVDMEVYILEPTMHVEASS